MLVIAMFLYALLPVDGFLAKLALRIALLPLVIGLSYELIRFAAKPPRHAAQSGYAAPACGCSASPLKIPTIPRPPSPSMP